MVTRADFDRWMVPVYSPAPFIPVSGQGSRVWDQQGKEYIDFAAGIAVNCLGHAHPKLIQALTLQAEQLWHVSNTLTNQPALKLAEKLIHLTFAEKVFFCNSGAEANEAALKLARRYGLETGGVEKNEIIAFHQSFHGRTFFTVTAGGQPKYSDGFGPKPARVTHLEFNNIEQFITSISDKTCAVIVELIQGEGGIIPATPAFIETLRKYCTQHNALLIFDEVQTGVGRTGHLYAYMGYGIAPDILTTAKGLGGGFPIGAMLTMDEIAKHFSFGTHGTTFGGNPLACAVAETVIDLVSDPVLLQGVIQKGEKITAQLNDIGHAFNCFSEIRGQGLILGAALSDPFKGRAREFMRTAADHGVMVLQAGPDVIRYVPSLIIPEPDIYEGMQRFRAAVSSVVHTSA